MTLQGTIAGTAQVHGHIRHRRRTGAGRCPSSSGPRADQTPFVSAWISGARSPAATESRARHPAHDSRWASRAHTSSAPIALSPTV
jgi:hypothetical protein